MNYTGYVTGPVGSEIARERDPQTAKLFISELRKWTDLQAIVSAVQRWAGAVVLQVERQGKLQYLAFDLE
jgi:hypothetical protein